MLMVACSNLFLLLNNRQVSSLRCGPFQMHGWMETLVVKITVYKNTAPCSQLCLREHPRGSAQWA